MKKMALLISVASFALAGVASAEETARASQTDAASSKTAEQGAAPKRESFSTGVAKARDLLDSAISTSSLDENDTESYSTVENSLRIPGYVTTNAFAQARITKDLLLSLNASNLMNVKAITGVADATIPTTGVVAARVLAGRTVSAAVRFDF